MGCRQKIFGKKPPNGRNKPSPMGSVGLCLIGRNKFEPYWTQQWDDDRQAPTSPANKFPDGPKFPAGILGLGLEFLRQTDAKPPAGGCPSETFLGSRNNPVCLDWA